MTSAQWRLAATTGYPQLDSKGVAFLSRIKCG
ncbi:hypothetical protein AVEN_28764-1, partial [Araneus ventricosus]